jgi:hypothetical protein
MKALSSISRRKFIAGSLAIPLVNLSGPVSAQDLPLVMESDATAMALGYKHNVADIDEMTFPRRSTEANGDIQFCDNCIFYTGAAGAENGPCALFPGKSVAAKGWCNTWTLKP